MKKLILTENNKITKLFETDNLLVRKLINEDITSFCKMQSNENVMKYILGKPRTKDESMKEYSRIINSYQNISCDFLIMAIAKKNCNEFMGTCAIIKNDDEEYEIGYRLMEKYWQNGYGTEALNGLLAFALDKQLLNSVIAIVEKDNIPSVKLLEKSDMDFIKEYKEDETGTLVRKYAISK